jgi:shikimate kinase
MDVNMVILVIGPSGVGKSTCVEYAAGKLSGCRFFDLDKLVGQRAGIPACELLGKVGADGFLQCCQHEVNAMLQSCTDIVSLVDVGAGALESPRASAWLSQHQGLTIAVVAPPDEVYRRGGWRNRNRNLDQFTRTEYSEYRQSLYNAATYRCDVNGLPVDDARTCFTDMLRTLLTKRDGYIGA